MTADIELRYSWPLFNRASRDHPPKPVRSASESRVWNRDGPTIQRGASTRPVCSACLPVKEQPISNYVKEHTTRWLTCLYIQQAHKYHFRGFPRPFYFGGNESASSSVVTKTNECKNNVIAWVNAYWRWFVSRQSRWQRMPMRRRRFAKTKRSVCVAKKLNFEYKRSGQNIKGMGRSQKINRSFRKCEIFLWSDICADRVGLAPANSPSGCPPWFNWLYPTPRVVHRLWLCMFKGYHSIFWFFKIKSFLYYFIIDCTAILMPVDPNVCKASWLDALSATKPKTLETQSCAKALSWAEKNQQRLNFKCCQNIASESTSALLGPDQRYFKMVGRHGTMDFVKFRRTIGKLNGKDSL